MNYVSSFQPFPDQETIHKIFSARGNSPPHPDTQFLIMHALCMLMFCARQWSLPDLPDRSAPASNISIGCQAYESRPASTSQYHKPRLGTVMGQRAFSYAWSHAWNALHRTTESRVAGSFPQSC